MNLFCHLQVSRRISEVEVEPSSGGWGKLVWTLERSQTIEAAPGYTDNQRALRSLSHDHELHILSPSLKFRQRRHRARQG